MIITCPECLTKFRLEEERIPEAGAKARCSKCQYVFQVRRPASPEESFLSRIESSAEFQALEKDRPPSRKLFSWWRWVILGLLVIAGIAVLVFHFAIQNVEKKGFKPLFAVDQFLSDKAAALKKAHLSLPFLKEYFRRSEPGEGFISLEKVRGYYLENNHLSRIFVVEGEATNHWKESRSFIKVKGTLLDPKGNKVREQEAFCGNTLSEKDLKEMSRETIEKSLSSQFGISFSNVNIHPNQRVPFMIVFTDLPPEEGQSKTEKGPGEKWGYVPPVLSDFTVEATSSQKGSK